MPPLRIQRFGGMIPRLNVEQMPDEGAERAHNVSLTGGAMSPIRVDGPYASMHDDDALLIAGVPSADVKFIAKPDKPYGNELEYIADPTQWLTIFAYDWVSHVDSTGELVVVNSRAAFMPILKVIYTETSMFLVSSLYGVYYTFLNGGPYALRGPRYRFFFAEDNPVVPEEDAFSVDEISARGRQYGGSDFQFAYPVVASEGDEEFPRNQIPLIDRTGNVYANFQCVDVVGPNYDEDILVTDYDFIFGRKPETLIAYVVFEINMNYVTASRTHSFYVSTALGAHDEEGPPSEVSPRLTILPGQRLTINTPRPAGFSKLNIYRSGTGGDDFLLVRDDLAAETWTDKIDQPQDIVIPPSGNYPNASAGDTEQRDKFLEGSVIHPAQFAVAFRDKTLYLSDPYRFHAWPDENTVPFTEGIKAIALSGNTILVFVGDRVFGVTGANPKAMDKRLLSDTQPLLNTQSLCRIGQNIYYSSYDGIIVATSGGVQVASTQHFTRREWNYFSPTEMVMTTADNSLLIESIVSTKIDVDKFHWLTPGEAVNIQFDLEEGIGAVSTYSALTDATAIWRTKRFWYDQEVTWDFARVIADGYPLTLRIFGTHIGQVSGDSPFPWWGARTIDGPPAAAPIRNETPSLELTIENDEYVPTIEATQQFFNPVIEGLSHANEWQVEVESDHIVRRIELFERTIFPVNGDAITMTDDQVECWRNIHVKFPNVDKFTVGMLTAQTTTTVPIHFYIDGDAEPSYTANVKAGRAFKLPKTLRLASSWHIDVQSPKRIEALTLAARKYESVQDTIRVINDGPFPPWLNTRYDFVDKSDVRSVVVNAATSVKMNLYYYYDGSAGVSESVTVAPGVQEVALTGGRFTGLEFDFTTPDDGTSDPPLDTGLLAQDDVVSEVIIHTNTAQVLAEGGLSLVNPESARNLLYRFPDRGHFAAASIGLDVYDEDTKLKLTADGAEVYYETVADGHVFRLPRTLADAALWQVDVETPNRIDTVNLYPRWPQQVEGGSLHITNPRTVPPWLFTTYEFTDQTELVSVRVEASQTVTLQLYADAADTPSLSVECVPGKEVLLDRLLLCKSLEFDFNGDDHLVTEIAAFGRNIETLGEGGVRLGRRANWRGLEYKFPDQGVLAVASVSASRYDSGDVTLRIFADGKKVYDEEVEDGTAIVFDRQWDLATEWKIDIDADPDVDIHGLVLMPRRTQRVDGTIRLVNGSDTPPWLYTRYEFEGGVYLRSVFLNCEDAVSMRIYADAGRSTTKTQTVSPRVESLIDLTEIAGSFEFDFKGEDHEVSEVLLFADTEQLVGDEGVNISRDVGWRGLRFKFAGEGTWAAAAVGCSEYSGVSLSLTGDSTKKTFSVADGKAFTLGRNVGRASQWFFDIVGADKVRNLVLMPRRRVRMESDSLRLVQSDNTIAPWLVSQYELPDRALLRSVIVHATSYPVTLKVYADSGTTATSFTIANQYEARLDGLGLMSSFDFEFDGDDSSINEVLMFAKTPQPAGDGGVTLQGNLSWLGNIYQFPNPVRPACLMVGASSYTDVVVRLYGDGTLVHTERVTSGAVVALPLTLSEASQWEIDVQTSAEVSSLRMIPWRSLPTSGGAIRYSADGMSIPSWMFTRHIFPSPVRVRSATVESGASSTLLQLFEDASSSPVEAIQLNDEFETPGPGAALYRSLIFNFAGTKNPNVREVAVFPEEHVPVGETGILLRSSEVWQPWCNKVLQFAEAGSFSVARIVCTSYPVTLTLTADGTDFEYTLADADDVKLDLDLPDVREWSLKIEQGGQIKEVALIARDKEPSDGDVVRIGRNGEPYSWLAKRVLRNRETQFQSVRVLSDTYPVKLTLYQNGAKVHTHIVMDADGLRLPRLHKSRDWSFDAECSDPAVIREVALGLSMGALRDG